ncbi:MAG: endonuclease/exonuclease/phosphatase family protein [Lewinellaceae bacterium]|nr:endonuclease/exonuclease/phosphatase family protein [Lewinellaceae bacterium]
MVNVLIYNTHLFDGIGTTLLPALQRFLGNPLVFEDQARLDAIIGHINSRSIDADVIGLTEVWADASKKKIIDKVKAKYPFSFFNKTSSLQMGDGLLLLSKVALEQPSFEAFNSLNGFDDLSQKGILSAVIQPADQPKRVLVILAHTQSGEAPNDKAARADNIQQLARRVSNLKTGSSDSIILMGDLNVIAEDSDAKPTAEYQQLLLPAMRSAGLTDIYRKLHAAAATDPGFTYDGTKNPLIKTFAAGDAALRQRLDYIFTSALPVATGVVPVFTYQSARPRAVIPTSDHFPVAGHIDVAVTVSNEENTRDEVVFGKTNLNQLAKDDGKTDRNDLLVSIENGTETTFDVNFNVEHGAFDKAHGSKLLPSPDFKRQNPEATHYEMGFEAVGAGCDVTISLKHDGITRRFRIVTPPNQSNYFKFDNGQDGFGKSEKNYSEDGFKTFFDGNFQYEVSLGGTSDAICRIRIRKVN